MPVAVPAAPQRAPRRARYLIPLGTPHRREVLAALTLLAVLASLLFAPVTLGLAVAFHAIGKITRWRPVWLAGPAACGLVWVLAIGPAAALTGFLAAPRAVLALLAGPGAAHPPRRLRRFRPLVPRPVPDRSHPGRGHRGRGLVAGLAAHRRVAPSRPPPGTGHPVRRRLTAAFVKSGVSSPAPGRAWGLTPAPAGPPRCPGGRRNEGCWSPAPRGPPCRHRGSSWCTPRSGCAGRDRGGPGPSPAWPPRWRRCARHRGAAAGLRAAGPGYYEPLRDGDPAAWRR